MRIFMRLLLLTSIVSIFFTTNVFAKNYNDDDFKIVFASPSTEEKHEDPSLDYRWVWVSDELCLRSRTFEGTNKDSLLEMWNMGFISRWAENDSGKVRDTYAGKWTLSEEGVWSFLFDDFTIPVGLTKIDGVLYAFNGFGQLKDGVEYWNGQTTTTDGVVSCEDIEFLNFLETQYLPDCTSHE